MPPKRPGEFAKEVVTSPNLPGIQAYAHGAIAARAGTLLFTAGDVGIDQHTGQLISSFADLADRADGLGYGRTHADQPLLPQAWHYFQDLKALLEANGASLESVVHQNFYLRDLAETPALERVAALFYGRKLPPTTAVP